MPDIAAWKLDNRQNGFIQPYDFNFKPLSLDELSQSLPVGAYTTFRTYEHHKVLNLEAHIDRLEETSKLLEKPVVLEREKLHRALRHAIEHYVHDEARVRITVDLTHQAGEIYLALEPLNIPSHSVYQNGVRTETRFLSRNIPRAKVTDFIHEASKARRSLEEGIYEIFIKNDAGDILEGLTSNFFAVINHTIITPGEGVLMGVTRDLVIQQIKKAGYHLKYSTVNQSQIESCQEIFLTSSSRAIIPVIEVDNMKIDHGRPGIIAKQLLQMYEDHIKTVVEPV